MAEKTLEELIGMLVSRGADFERVEEFIDGLPLDDDRRAALWLLAWSELPRRRRQQILASTV